MSLESNGRTLLYCVSLNILNQINLSTWQVLLHRWQVHRVCLLKNAHNTIHIWTKDEVGTPLNQFKPSSKILYWPFWGGTLLWIFYVCSVLCLLCLYMILFICALWSPAGKRLTSWLSFVASYCDFVIFPLVSLVRCSTWLHRFLIFAP